MNFELPSLPKDILFSLKELPPVWEFLLPALPRSWLNQIEITRLPASFSLTPSLAEIRRKWSGTRVALIKQALYGDLYCCVSRSPARDAVQSSLRRTGPMGFLTDLGADYWQVLEDPAPECRTWKESPGSNPATDLKELRNHQHKIPHKGRHGHIGSPAEMSVSVDEVPWNEYDVIISLDIAVPLRIIRQHPRIFWVYFPTDPGAPTAKRSRRVPPTGYNVSLTHTHRRFPIRPGLGSRAIECPYSFQSSFSWSQIWPEPDSRSGIMIEHQTHALLTLDQLKTLVKFGPIRKPFGSVSEVAHSLRSSKYYLRLAGGPLSGNGQIEAIMAGCLAIGNPETYVQRSLFTPSTVAPSFPHALALLEKLEAMPDLYEITRAQQLQVAEFICFRRPAHQLLSFL